MTVPPAVTVEGVTAGGVLPGGSGAPPAASAAVLEGCGGYRRLSPAVVHLDVLSAGVACFGYQELHDAGLGRGLDFVRPGVAGAGARPAGCAMAARRPGGPLLRGLLRRA